MLPRVDDDRRARGPSIDPPEPLGGYRKGDLRIAVMGGNSDACCFKPHRTVFDRPGPQGIERQAKWPEHVLGESPAAGVVGRDEDTIADIRYQWRARYGVHGGREFVADEAIVPELGRGDRVVRVPISIGPVVPKECIARATRLDQRQRIGHRPEDDVLVARSLFREDGRVLHQRIGRCEGGEEDGGADRVSNEQQRRKPNDHAGERPRHMVGRSHLCRPCVDRLGIRNCRHQQHGDENEWCVDGEAARPVGVQDATKRERHRGDQVTHVIRGLEKRKAFHLEREQQQHEQQVLNREEHAHWIGRGLAPRHTLNEPDRHDTGDARQEKPWRTKDPAETCTLPRVPGRQCSHHRERRRKEPPFSRDARIHRCQCGREDHGADAEHADSGDRWPDGSRAGEHAVRHDRRHEHEPHDVGVHRAGECRAAERDEEVPPSRPRRVRHDTHGQQVICDPRPVDVVPAHRPQEEWIPGGGGGDNERDVRPRRPSQREIQRDERQLAEQKMQHVVRHDRREQLVRNRAGEYPRQTRGVVRVTERTEVPGEIVEESKIDPRVDVAAVREHPLVIDQELKRWQRHNQRQAIVNSTESRQRGASTRSGDVR